MTQDVDLVIFRLVKVSLSVLLSLRLIFKLSAAQGPKILQV